MADLNQMPQDPLQDIHDNPVAHDPDDNKVSDDNQVFDSATNIDATEAYDEGKLGAAEVPPPPDPAVVDYDPEKDQRNTTDTE